MSLKPIFSYGLYLAGFQQDCGQVIKVLEEVKESDAFTAPAFMGQVLSLLIQNKLSLPCTYVYAPAVVGILVLLWF